MIKLIKESDFVYKMLVVLEESSPRIWRRFVISANSTLYQLHKTLQIVMGWTECHLHEFLIDGKHYGEPSPEYDGSLAEMLNHRKFKIYHVVPSVGGKFKYIYDFGDGWQHNITVEDMYPKTEGERYPICLTGANACPPEDSGNLPGYYEKLQIMKDPAHPEYEDIKEWMGPDFDPAAFDLVAVNLDLRNISRR
jgi:hypothetical protein